MSDSPAQQTPPVPTNPPTGAASTTMPPGAQSTPVGTTPPPPSQTPPVLPNNPPGTPKEKHGSPASAVFFALLMFVIGIGIGYVLFKEFPMANPAGNMAEKTQTTMALQLPKDAQKIQDCVPQKGALYIRSQDIPQGPIYMVQNNKVIGLEYTLNKDAFTNGQSYDFLASLNMHADHLAVSTMAQGYDGNLGPFYVVDMYTINKDAEQAITCGNQSKKLMPSAMMSMTPQASTSGVPTPTPMPLTAPQSSRELPTPTPAL